MPELVVLNDGETYSGISGVVIIDHHKIAYDLARLWHHIPISIRELARLGDAERHVKAAVWEDTVWP